MTPNQYVKLALVTESNNFTNKSLLGRLTESIFRSVHKNTLANRMSQTRSIRLFHAFVGISTEIEEIITMLDKTGDIDKTNLIEEVADSLWYCAIAVDELGFDFDSLVKRASEMCEGRSDLNEAELRAAVEGEIRSAIKYSGRLLDVVKKGAMYGGKPLNIEAIEMNLLLLLTNLVESCQCSGFSLSDAMERNIAKLSFRFKDKFSAHAALNRDLETERKILEKTK
jgi:NTP pyrophosphatase (non-canonical NTP hydrolase)